MIYVKNEQGYLNEVHGYQVRIVVDFYTRHGPLTRRGRTMLDLLLAGF